jgi:23S rRNA pseudouridine1911/1915/1917 synthase
MNVNDCADVERGVSSAEEPHKTAGVRGPGQATATRRVLRSALDLARGLTRPAQRPALPSRSVPEDLAGPLDRAVRGLLGVSWGKARAYVESGKVRVGGQVVTDVTARVAPGADVAIDEHARKARAVELTDDQVLHVDAHVIVVAKPAGISTVPFDEGEGGRPSDQDTLDARVRAWLERRRLVARVGQGRPSLGIVHRIDKETSGLVVFTRSWLAKTSLAGQFRRHTVEREYLAIAHGTVPARTFRTFFIENRGDGLRGSARGKKPPADAREAVTHVEPRRLLPGGGASPRATLVACRLETGRTHQIRIHLSESGHPIAGDRVYIRHYTGPRIEAPRLMLHAAALGFIHPATEQPVAWSLPLPDDMQALIEALDRPGEAGRVERLATPANSAKAAESVLKHKHGGAQRPGPASALSLRQRVRRDG